MKSGTNQFHGAAFDYFVNEGLNAGTPFTDRIATGDATRAGQQWLISTVSAFRDMDKTNTPWQMEIHSPPATGLAIRQFLSRISLRNIPTKSLPACGQLNYRSSRSTGTPDVLLDRYTGASVCSISSQTI